MIAFLKHTVAGLNHVFSRRLPVILLSIFSALFGIIFFAYLRLYSLLSSSPDISYFNSGALDPVTGLLAPVIEFMVPVYMVVLPVVLLQLVKMFRGSAGDSYGKPARDIQSLFASFLAGTGITLFMVALFLPAVVLWHIWGGYVHIPVLAVRVTGLFLMSTVILAITLFVRSFITHNAAAFLIALVFISGIILLPLLNVRLLHLPAGPVHWWLPAANLDLFLRGNLSARAAMYVVCITALFLFSGITVFAWSDKKRHVFLLVVLFAAAGLFTAQFTITGWEWNPAESRKDFSITKIEEKREAGSVQGKYDEIHYRQTAETDEDTWYRETENQGHPLVVPANRQRAGLFLYIAISLLLLLQLFLKERIRSGRERNGYEWEPAIARGMRTFSAQVSFAGDQGKKGVMLATWLVVFLTVVVVNERLPAVHRSHLVPSLSGLIPEMTFFQGFVKDRNQDRNRQDNTPPVKEEQGGDSEQVHLHAGEDNGYLKNFFLKLKSLEKGKKETVRILHYGDSLIWGDCFSIVVKRRFQDDFGDGGRGIVPVIETLPTTLRDHENTTDPSKFKYYRIYHEFKTGGVFTLLPDVNRHLGFTGESAVPLSPRSEIAYEAPDGLSLWEEVQVYLRAPESETPGKESFTVQLDTGDSQIENTLQLEPGAYGVAEFDTAPTGSLEISIAESGSAPPYIDGVNLETGGGVAYSTVVRMGTHLAWLRAVPEKNLADGLRMANPDLVIFQYGVNEAASIRGFPEFSGEDFRRQLREALVLFKEILPETDILLIGPPERFLPDDGSLIPFHETLEVRQTQKETARSLSLAFFDTYSFLGGEGHMKVLVDRGLAMDDYTHLTIRGGTLVADGFYDTLMKEYRDAPAGRTLSLAENVPAGEDTNRAIQFNSRAYAYFLIIVLGAGLALLRFPQLRFLFLVLASYYFYATWKVWPLVLLVTSTVVDYFLAFRIHNAQKKGERGNAYLVISLACNLGLLFVFKYADFFSGLVNSLLDGYGLETGIPMLDTVLPVGISFYTFQTLSYTIDVWRKEMEPERNFLKFALFVSFFPQLVAGPIVRAKQFLPALKEKARHFMVTHRNLGSGIFLIFTGLVKKMGADWLAVSIVDRVYANPGMFTTAETLTAVYAYGLQIYGDFSGYTDIAIGSAMLLGFNLVENFRRPYASVSVSDFWRRWHISLGSWFRDYLYISLGGNRQRVYLNLFITMVLCGLWHGAGVQFLLWGIFHGLLLIIEGVFKINRGGGLVGIVRAVRTAVTLHAVLFGWIIFRSDSWETFTGILNNLAEFSAGAPNVGFLLVSIIVVAYGYHFTPPEWKERLRNYWEVQPPYLQGLVAAAMTFLVYNLAITGGRPFIYFQF